MSRVAGTVHAAGGSSGSARHVTRRRLLRLASAAAAIPLPGPLRSVRASTVAHRDLGFRVMRHGSPIGEHRVTFRPDIYGWDRRLAAAIA